MNETSLKSPLPHLVGRWTFLGDIYGRLQTIPNLDHPVIQLGDPGTGFVSEAEDIKFLRSRKSFWFIRGNHDNPVACKKHPSFMGDWGQHELIFWVSGAWSIDRQFRQEGVSWWREEDLTFKQGQEAFNAYVAAKPRLMITHDAPTCLFKDGGPIEIYCYQASSTTTLLQNMFVEHQPEIWLFGHHHKRGSFTLRHKQFRCLDVNECASLYIEASQLFLA